MKVVAVARYQSPLLMLILYSTIVGFAFPLSKIALREGIAPTSYVFWQCFGAGCVCLSFCLIKRLVSGLNIRTVLFCLMVGVVGFALPNSVMIYSLQVIPAGTMGLVISTLPLLTVIFGICLRLEIANKWILAGVAIGILGAAILFIPMLRAQSDSFGMTRLLLAFITPVLYAISGLLIARYFPKGVSSISVTAGMLFSASLFLLPYTVITTQEIITFDVFSLLGLILGLQIIISSISYALYFEITNQAGAIFMSQAAYLVPFSATLWSVILINEHITMTFMAAALCVIVGLACISRGRTANLAFS